MSDSNLHLPRILCLHGAGSNAAVFRSQCRAILPRLENHFRFCFVDGPFISEAGAGLFEVYGELAPFRRWLPWRLGIPAMEKLSDGSQISDEASYEAINKSIRDAMQRDDDEGGTGEWVGILGFSQGAKLAASLLFRQQVREKSDTQNVKTHYRFGVLMNGPAPLMVFDQQDSVNEDLILRIPTLHVHSSRDPDLPYHRLLKTQYCDEETSQVFEWNGDHRVPLMPKDFLPVVERILALARSTSALQG